MVKFLAKQCEFTFKLFPLRKSLGELFLEFNESFAGKRCRVCEFFLELFYLSSQRPRGDLRRSRPRLGPLWLRLGLGSRLWSLAGNR